MSSKTQKKKQTEFVTKQKYDSIEECYCGGPVFKYHDVSKNVFVIKCGYFKKVIDIEKETKKKIWVTPKKVQCDWSCMYNGSRPEFKEINKTLTIFVDNNVKDAHQQLEEKLKLLFKFLYLSNHTSTLDEINLLVKNNLCREPRKTFYYPSIGHFMRVSHYEPFGEYEKRIFSKKIIDQSFIMYEKYNENKQKEKQKEKEKEKKKKKVVEETLEEPILSQFIVAESDHSDQESGDENEELEEELDDIEEPEETEETEPLEDTEELLEETEDNYEENYDDEYDDVVVYYYYD